MSSGFVTETELAEARQKRQEEWEKVRQPDQPLERPEEPYDSRSLYERLKEQKDKKDLEYEETHKLKNLIRGLDDDEVDFLDIIDKARSDAEKKQQMEENNELLEFRQRVASLQENAIDQKISTEKAVTQAKPTKLSTRPSQKSLLGGIVRKRTSNETSDNGNAQPNNEPVPKKLAKTDENNPTEKKIEENGASTEATSTTNQSAIVSSDLKQYDQGALKCIGILPGIGKYRESSDSEKSTDTEDDYDFSGYDWIGRKIKKGGGECQ